MAQQQQDERRSALWRDLDARFRAPLLSFFLRRVQDRSEAEDLTQEVFARLTKQAETPQGEHVQAYVFVIASNLLRDRNRVHIRRRALAHHNVADEAARGQVEVALIEDRNPERVLLAKETLQEFLSALDRLNERTRDIFILSRIEHMHQGDIAKLFGISVSAVEKHVMRALAKLGERLAAK